MRRRDRKRIILCQLGQEAVPISLADLLDKLGYDCTERTLRRWLNELIEESLIKKSGNTKGAKYIATKMSTNISFERQLSTPRQVSSCFGTNIPLITGNLVPLAFSDIEVKDYMPAIIAIYELQDIRPIVDLYAYSYLRTCAAYDSTVKALGFDEVRVRYRPSRRNIIREIILQRLIGFNAQDYIKKKSEEIIPKADQKAFLEDILEDLEELDHSRIAGFGVTLQQLDGWLELYQNDEKSL